MLFQWVLLKLSAEQKTVKLLWVAYLSFSGFELGMSRHAVNMLQQAAFEQLVSESKVKAAPLIISKSVYPKRCALNKPE
jgi:hypothetical protein